MPNPQITWEASVARARRGNLAAVRGRFEVALASFEQIGQHGEGTRHADRAEGESHTLLDFADEVGIEYGTLNSHRGIVNWWLDSDPLGLIGEIGVPDSMTWNALRWGKNNLMLAADVRAELAGLQPPNGKTWTAPDLERHLRHLMRHAPAPPAESEAEGFQAVMRTMNSLVPRLRGMVMRLEDSELTDQQRGELHDAVERARDYFEQLRQLAEEAALA